ncbi:MAG: flagellar hook protein FlgE [Gammaproteobacteria bacterium]|nr:flagellar hook protein FlgE [Gammaproteobacteria bacterium]MCP5316722.1 flagellar hook protein FlgE [Chromatiaceae bacterium]MCW5585991.1 flagellar hook protein FlgE [Chromatiales bacterium]MCB1818062.1 flagellar hook protein FlgE [Gammaproteobacteria bacterium]MCP5429567.1 flagellar hook protein FlgE [Chromatiaceae bacterium]
MTFRIALSGLNAASTELEVTGNNIANSGTNGFKESRTEFGDLFANAIQDTANAAGQGVRVARVAQQFSQGSIDFTSNNLDLAISGQGFFVLESPDGTQAFTRAGAYSVDRNGYVINNGNDRLQIYEATAGVGGSTTFNTGVLQDLQLPTTPSAPSATGTMSVAVNLNSSDTTPGIAFDPAVSTSYNRSTSTTVYDSLGNAHTSTMYYVKGAAPNDWDQYLYVDGTNVPPAGQAVGTPFALSFSSSGALSTIDGVAATTADTAAYDPANGAASMTLTIDLTGTTQYGSSFAVNNLSQDGFTSGRLAGVDIDAEGVVFARYTNGQSSALGKVAMAKFNNQQGLRQVGDTNWAESFASGTPQLGEAGTSSFGQIQSGALEASNVDIAAQLVNLITAQRNFQANAEVISTADAVTQTIINIR